MTSIPAQAPPGAFDTGAELTAMGREPELTGTERTSPVTDRQLFTEEHSAETVINALGAEPIHDYAKS